MNLRMRVPKIKAMLKNQCCYQTTAAIITEPKIGISFTRISDDLDVGGSV